MSTLSNVTPGRGKFLPQNVGLTANVSSRESLDGVSVRYAPDPSKKWFVLRATYHRELKAYDYLINHGIEAFLPLHRTLKYVDGKRKFVIESYLPNMLFVYASPETVENCVKHTPDLHFLSYYYNHFCGNRRRKESASHRTIRFDDEFHQDIYHRQPSRQGGESRELPFQEWRHGEGDRWRIQGSRRQGGKSIRPAEGCGRSRRSLPDQHRLYS